MTPLPMLAKLIPKPFDQKGWIFETKWDGYRALGKKGKSILLYSRNRKSFNARFPTIVAELKTIPGQFILDGEIVIFDQRGLSNFQLLQNYQTTKKGIPYYYVFDVLFHDGKKLVKLPLLQRKQILKKLLAKGRHPHIRYSNHTLTKGKALFQKALRKGWEGVIAKRAESPYQSHRSSDWLKIKTSLRQEVVIGGFTQPRGSRKRFGSLLVGVYKGGKLHYSGHMGGGFDEELLENIYHRLKRVESSKCPFSEEPHPNMPVTWVRPQLVCEVSFTEWTQGGMMRHPVFKGMRIDKSAKQVVREKPIRRGHDKTHTPR